MDSPEFEVITSDSHASNVAWSNPQSAAFGWIQPEEFAKDFVKVHHDDPYSQLQVKFWGNDAAFPTGIPSVPSPLDDDGSVSEHLPAEAALVDEDDIRPGCGIIDVGVPSFIRKLFVRADYMRIYDRLEQQRLELSGEGGPESAAVVGILTGHPGVGKSVWMVYGLLRRLAERKTTVVFLGTYCLVLTEDGVYKFSDFSYLRCLRLDTWILADSEHAPNCLPRALVRHNHVAFTVYATFPSEERWSWVNDISSVVIAVMNPWTRTEIHHLASEKGLALERVDEAFDLLGPLPRLCIDFLLQRPTYRRRYEQGLELAIQHVPAYMAGVPWALRTPYAPSGFIEVDQTRVTLAIISRAQREDVESALRLPIITPYIAQRLLGQSTIVLTADPSAFSFYTTSPDATSGIDVLALRASTPQTVPSAFRYIFHVTSSTTVDDSTGLRSLRLTGMWHELYRNSYRSVSIPSQSQSATPSVWFLYKPETIVKDTIYIQILRHNRLLDSFVVVDGHLYIFRATKTAQETLSVELLGFFEGYDCIPACDQWSIIFVVPNLHSLLYAIPNNEKLKKVSPCTIPAMVYNDT